MLDEHTLIDLGTFITKIIPSVSLSLKKITPQNVISKSVLLCCENEVDDKRHKVWKRVMSSFWKKIKLVFRIYKIVILICLVNLVYAVWI